MSRSTFLVAAALATTFACSADDDAGGDDDLQPADGSVDDGDVRGADAGAPDASPLVWSFADVNGVPNLDDDDGNGVRDFDQDSFDLDDDMSIVQVPGELAELMAAGDRVALSLAGDASAVRVWLAGELVLGDGAAESSVTVTGLDSEIAIEFADFRAAATLTIDRVDDAGAVLDSAEVALEASPLILNHHLQPSEHVWIVSVNGNASMIAAFQTALGSSFTAVPGSSYGWDVWIQDEIEFATATGEQGQRLDVVVDSIRDRGLDPFAERDLVGPGVIAETWGSGQPTTFDSFGNLEASPPVTVDGVDYPFGRIYYGRRGQDGLSTVLASFLASQKVQAPFEIDTTWLCVGHVDEFSSVVPDPSSPKGFKLLLSDVPSAWALLQSMDPATPLTRYELDHGYATVGDLLADQSLIDLNDDLQADYLDPIKAQFKAELGLSDDDIILVPSLFEPACGPYVAALIPGMVNLIVASQPGDPTHLFVADPFFRDDVDDQSADPFIAAFTASMPAGLEIDYVDNWDVYHMGLGEVHCGTNVQRTPVESWWAPQGEE